MGENHSLSIGEAEASSGQRGGQFALFMCFGFLLVGVVGTLLGPILPMLAAKWQVGDAEVSWLFVAQFSGGIIGSALSGRMIARVGLLRLLTYGYAATAAAVACLGGLGGDSTDGHHCGCPTLVTALVSLTSEVSALDQKRT